MTQRDSLLDLFGSGGTYTMDELEDKVLEQTGKDKISRNSLLVQISHLRKDGYKIESARVDGTVHYKLRGSKGRRRERSRVAV